MHDVLQGDNDDGVDMTVSVNEEMGSGLVGITDMTSVRSSRLRIEGHEDRIGLHILS